MEAADGGGVLHLVVWLRAGGLECAFAGGAMITAAEIQQLLDNRPAAKPKPKPLGNGRRAGYWSEYHAHRQATDPAYRARKTKAALKHKANHG